MPTCTLLYGLTHVDLSFTSFTAWFLSSGRVPNRCGNRSSQSLFRTFGKPLYDVRMFLSLVALSTGGRFRCPGGLGNRIFSTICEKRGHKPGRQAATRYMLGSTIDQETRYVDCPTRVCQPLACQVRRRYVHVQSSKALLLCEKAIGRMHDAMIPL